MQCVSKDQTGVRRRSDRTIRGLLIGRNVSHDEMAFLLTVELDFQ